MTYIIWRSEFLAVLISLSGVAWGHCGSLHTFYVCLQICTLSLQQHHGNIYTGDLMMMIVMLGRCVYMYCIM